jgi:hypothetical protein
MSWQAHLFIGVPISTYEDIRKIMLQLSGNLEWRTADKGELFYDLPAIEGKSVKYKGNEYPVKIRPMRGIEGGSKFPPNDPSYTDAMIGFELTSRYAPAILDQGYEYGRPEPFVFDPLDIADILQQVRKWWPEAQAIIWDIWH